MNNPFDKLLSWYFSKNSLPYWCILLLDCAIVMFCGLLTYWIFNNAVQLFENTLRVINTMVVFVFLSIPGFRLFHTYSGFMRYSSFVDLMRVAYGNAVGLVLWLIAVYFMHNTPNTWFAYYSNTSVCVLFIIATLLMWAVRVFVKTLYEVAFSNTRAMRVLIYGAMTGGVGLAKSIRSQRPKRFVVKGFITHNKLARHQQIMGEKVYLTDDNLSEVILKNDIDAVMVSPYRVKEFRENQKVQDEIISAGAKIYMTQTAFEVDPDLLESDVPQDFSHMQMREVSVEELLPRSEIRVDLKSIGELLAGKRVLVTGAAGSIGSEICRQVARLKPAAMMLIDQAETPEHDIRLMMQKKFPDIPAETVVTSICKEKRMEELFKRFRPDYVFHAAAYKHVPMMEDNPSEAVQNNIYGTKVIADLSVKYGAEKFVMVSTDKAVNPTNVMGCSKRICEIYVQSLDLAIKQKLVPCEKRTQFVTTRFGNVLGSNGSVIPLFREQIKNGGPVTVTDERIVRFFMLIPEACKLVLEAGTKGNGGEIFVFDMGQPVKIADLAQRMIKLSGAKNVEIQFTGLRPGEKLYEEVLNELEGTKPTFHEKIRIAEVREYNYDEVCKDISELIDISKQYDDMATVAKMKQIVPEYKSNNSIYEELDKKDA